MKNTVGTTNTTNGALTFDKTGSKVLDLYSSGAAMRGRSDSDVIKLFLEAFDENPLLALKALFYIRDIRGGQGERKVFKTCLKELAKNYSSHFTKNMSNVVKFGRWDDLFVAFDTPAERAMLDYVTQQLSADARAESGAQLSLLAKWMPSANTSSTETRRLAYRFIKHFKVTPRKYRTTLSKLRAALNVVETKMSSGKWSDINFSTVPSKANLVYKKAFSKHEPVRYTEFIQAVKSGEVKMNAGTLYPYEIIRDIENGGYGDKNVIDAIWNSLPDYLKDNPHNALVLPDVSGSMDQFYGTSTKPIWVSVALAIYFAQRSKGFFKDHFLEFSSTSKLVKIRSNNIVDLWNEVRRSTTWCGSTDLQSAFDAILNAAVSNKVPANEMPDVIYIISDMQFNSACVHNSRTNFDVIESKYKLAGYKMPSICFWQVNAVNNQSPVTKDQNGVTLVSGCSPSIFGQAMSGGTITPYNFMLETLNKERYSSVVV